MNKLTVLYKIRNNLLCIKENGYLERADSRTRDASLNYQLKSAKTELFKHSFFINTPKIWNKLPSVMTRTCVCEQKHTMKLSVTNIRLILNNVSSNATDMKSGLDIGYVPAGTHAFLRLSGQFGPLQLIFHWPEGPVDFFFFFSASYAAIIFTGNRQNSEGNVNSYLFFRYI